MKYFVGVPGIVAVIAIILSGCQTGGGGQATTLQEGAKAFTMSELYNYFAEQTQVRKDGGVYYTGFGTLTLLKDGERSEGTWASYSDGKLCRLVDEEQVGPCEYYYHNGDAVAVKIDNKIMPAPKMMEGNQIDLLATGSSRKMFTRDETIALVSGKTHAWENYNGAYYAPDFKLITLWDSMEESGKWSVNEEGELCWHIPSWGNGPCEGFYMGPDGTLMSVYKGKEDVADKLLDGNQLDNL